MKIDFDNPFLFDKFRRMYLAYYDCITDMKNEENAKRIKKQMEEDWSLLKQGITDWRVSDCGLATLSEIRFEDSEYIEKQVMNKLIDEMKEEKENAVE